jgi:hypothetical protein
MGLDLPLTEGICVPSIRITPNGYFHLGTLIPVFRQRLTLLLAFLSLT